MIEQVFDRHCIARSRSGDVMTYVADDDVAQAGMEILLAAWFRKS